MSGFGYRGHLQVAALAVAALSVSAVASAEEALVPLPIPVDIKTVMTAVTADAADTVWALPWMEEAPTDEDWSGAERAAIALIASATLATVPGPTESERALVADKDYLAQAAAFQALSVSLREASSAQDFDALLTLGDELVSACSACHKHAREMLEAE